MRLFPLSIAIAAALSTTAGAQERTFLTDQLRERLAAPRSVLCDSVIANDCFAVLARRVEYRPAAPDRFCERFSGSTRRACQRLQRDLDQPR